MVSQGAGSHSQDELELHLMSHSNIRLPGISTIELDWAGVGNIWIRR